MAFKRKRTTKRYVRRVRARRTSRSRSTRSYTQRQVIGNRTYWFNRGIDNCTTNDGLVYTAGSSNSAGFTLAAGASYIGFGYAPCLQDVINETDFTTLFDQFKITKFVCKFRLVTNPDSSTFQNVVAPVNASNTYPLLYLFSDHDDIVAPSLLECRERQGVKCVTLQPNKWTTMVIRPRVLQSLIGAGQMISGKPQWLDCAQITTPHYGIRGGLHHLSGLATQSYQVICEIRLTFAMRGVR